MIEDTGEGRLVPDYEAVQQMPAPQPMSQPSPGLSTPPGASPGGSRLTKDKYNQLMTALVGAGLNTAPYEHLKPEEEKWIEWGPGKKRNLVTGEVQSLGRGVKLTKTDMTTKDNEPVYIDESGETPQTVKLSKSGQMMPLSKEEIGPEKRVLPAEESKALATFDSLHEQAKQIIKLSNVSNYKDVIGPVAARSQWALSKIKETPEYSDISSRVGKLLETAYALSGKQISEKEMKKLEEQFYAQLESPSGNFQTVMTNFLSWLKRKETMVRAGHERVGYRVGESKLTEGLSKEDLADVPTGKLKIVKEPTVGPQGQLYYRVYHSKGKNKDEQGRTFDLWTP
jgi:hypothetical protein